MWSSINWRFFFWLTNYYRFSMLLMLIERIICLFALQLTKSMMMMRTTKIKNKIPNWKQCSVTCDTGFKVRSAICVQNNTIVNSNECDEFTKPKDLKSNCQLDPCWRKVFWTNHVQLQLILFLYLCFLLYVLSLVVVICFSAGFGLRIKILINCYLGRKLVLTMGKINQSKFIKSNPLKIHKTYY